MNLTNRPRLNLESLDDRLVPARIDLRTAGAEALLANGAIAHQMHDSWDTANGSLSHGTGALDTYLTVGGGTLVGVERGYNTNHRPVQFDTVDTPTTRALPLANVPVVTVGGVQYREFVLNVDQELVAGERQLSVDELQIFTSTLGNLRNYNNANNTLRASAPSSVESPVWNLDSVGNDWLQVRAVNNQGTQAGELAVLIPNNLFSPSETFVYIYSRMGVNRDANLGAEQWGVRSGPAASQSISGQLYLDGNENGTFESEFDSALSGVFDFVVTDPNNVDTTYQTNADGSFTLSNLAVGTYYIMIVDQNPYMSLTGINGSNIGNDDGEPGSNLLIIELGVGENATGYGFLMGFEGGGG